VGIKTWNSKSAKTKPSNPLTYEFRAKCSRTEITPHRKRSPRDSRLCSGISHCPVEMYRRGSLKFCWVARLWRVQVAVGYPAAVLITSEARCVKNRLQKVLKDFSACSWIQTFTIVYTNRLDVIYNLLHLRHIITMYIILCSTLSSVRTFIYICIFRWCFSVLPWPASVAWPVLYQTSWFDHNFNTLKPPHHVIFSRKRRIIFIIIIMIVMMFSFPTVSLDVLSIN